jgi:phosphoesterase RecJ-like protein
LEKNVPISVLNTVDKKQLKIVITTHHKPDADAMGSSLGLKNLLKNQGYDPVVITPTDYAHFLQWMSGNDEVIIFEHHLEKSKKLVEEADLIFCLDFNDLKRINDLGELVESSKAKKVMIDHHRDPKNFDDYRYWTIDTSSTSELIYDLANDWNMGSAIDADVASCLYAGIMSDTGGFRHNNTNASTHKAAADLISLGADNVKIHDLLLDNFSEERTRLIGYSMYKKLEVLPEYKTAIMHLTRKDLTEFNVKTGDTEGLVNYGLSIKGIVFSVLIIDRSVLVKMSFRSKGNFPCNEFAQAHFNGGGHKNASGGASKDTLENTISKFKEVLKDYKELLWKED